MASLGKDWEKKFKEDWKNQFPEGDILRLQDAMSGYKLTSQNPCDFICFADRKQFMVECKETNGNTLNFHKIHQLDDLLTHTGKPYIYPGVLVWFSDHDVIYWVDAIYIKKMIEDGKKSIHVNMLDAENKYKILNLTGKVNRVFVTGDYKKLVEREDQIWCIA